ncbi:hypothetical protein Mapa_007726 [Marchantia paleacea]|nr:hypothetical protein Mapa_007726 [Marchantia paleacea]
MAEIVIREMTNVFITWFPSSLTTVVYSTASMGNGTKFKTRVPLPYQQMRGRWYVPTHANPRRRLRLEGSVARSKCEVLRN